MTIGRKTTIKLTAEERETLTHAKTILSDMCDKLDYNDDIDSDLTLDNIATACEYISLILEVTKERKKND